MKIVALVALAALEICNPAVVCAQGRRTPTTSAGVPTTRTISTTAPLAGGGSLASDLTLSCPSCVTTARTISTTAPLAGGGSLASNLTLTLGTTGPGAGTYGGGANVVASLTLDAYGRVSAVTTGAGGGGGGLALSPGAMQSGYGWLDASNGYWRSSFNASSPATKPGVYLDNSTTGGNQASPSVQFASYSNLGLSAWNIYALGRADAATGGDRSDFVWEYWSGAAWTKRMRLHSGNGSGGPELWVGTSDFSIISGDLDSAANRAVMKFTGNSAGNICWGVTNAACTFYLDNASIRPSTSGGLTSGTSSQPWAASYVKQRVGVTVGLAATATPIFNLASGENQTITMNQNITSITIQNAAAAQIVTLEFTQNGTGGFTVAGWPASVKFSNGAPLAINLAPNARTWITLRIGFYYEEIARGGDISTSAWTAAPYSAAWVDYGGTSYYNGQFIKSPDGVVRLRGLLKPTSNIAAGASSTICTLPAGYRPSKILIVTIQTADASGGSYVTHGVQIYPTGVVEWEGAATGINTTGWASLDGINFVAEQ